MQVRNRLNYADKGIYVLFLVRLERSLRVKSEICVQYHTSGRLSCLKLQLAPEVCVLKGRLSSCTSVHLFIRRYEAPYSDLRSLGSRTFYPGVARHRIQRTYCTSVIPVRAWRDLIFESERR